MELGTSARMRSIVPMMVATGLFETGAAARRPDTWSSPSRKVGVATSLGWHDFHPISYKIYTDVRQVLYSVSPDVTDWRAKAS
jgi:hypothetical protein